MSVNGFLLRAALGASVLAVTACTTLGPDFETPPAEIIETWDENSQSLDTDDLSAKWWSVFNDPTLDRLIELSYKQNLPLQVAGLRIFESRAQLGIAIGQQYPQNQQVNGGLTKIGLSENAPNGTPADDVYYNQSRIGFDAAWEVDFWGRFRRGVESASANLGASVADYDNALVALTSEVARTYVRMRTLEERLTVAVENRETQRRSYQLADIRFRNGAVSELDPSQALSLLRSTESRIPRIESQIRQSKNALSILLGKPPGDLQDVLEGPKVIPQTPDELDIGMPADLLRRRPDIRQAELKAASQSALIGVAKTDLYPRFALLGSVGFLSSNTNESSNGDTFNSDSLGYSIGPSVSWQILNYGRIKNNVRVQDARLEKLITNYQNTVLEAAREVQDGISGYLGSTDQRGFLAQSVQASKRSVALSLEQYRQGSVDYQRVLDTQQTLLNRQDEHAAVKGEAVESLVAIYKALGGGWEIRAGNAFVDEQRQAAMKERTDWGEMLEAAQQTDELPTAPPTGNAQPLLNSPYW